MTELNNNMDFEQAYTALKETVAALEGSNNSLDDMIALYDRACRLVVHCQRKLNETKGRIEDINEHIHELKVSGAPMFEE